MISLVRKLGTVVCAALLMTSACKDKDGNKNAKPKVTDPTKVGTGSSTGAGTGEPVKQPEPVKAKTQDELAAWYKACWQAWSIKAWDTFAECYAEHATSESAGTPKTTGRAAIIASAKETAKPWPDLSGELQLVLVNGHHILGIALLRGTHTAPFKLPDLVIPPSNKKFGYLFAHLVEVDDKGQVVKEWGFADTGTLMGQLGVNPEPHRPAMAEGWADKPTILARNDATEKANLALFASGVEAFNKHENKALVAMSADDLVWSELAMPKDLDKKAMARNLDTMWKGFSDAKLTPAVSFSGGDYVVAVSTLAGTNDGVMKEMHLDKSGKKMAVTALELQQYKDGKLAKGWLFYDGGQLAMQLGLGAAPAGDKKAQPGKGDSKSEAPRPPANP